MRSWRNAMRCTRTTPPSAITTRSRLKWSPCHCRHRRSRSVWRSTTPTWRDTARFLVRTERRVDTDRTSPPPVVQTGSFHRMPVRTVHPSDPACWRTCRLHALPLSRCLGYGSLTQGVVMRRDAHCAFPQGNPDAGSGRHACRCGPSAQDPVHWDRPSPQNASNTVTCIGESSTWHPRMGRQHEPKVPNTNQRSEEWKEPRHRRASAHSKW